MAKQRKTSDDNDFDFDDGTSNAAHSVSAVEQPAPPTAADLGGDPIQLLARHLGVSPEQIGDLGKLQQQGQLFALADDVKTRAQKIKSEEEGNLIRERCGKTARERTQEAIDHNWKKEGVVVFRVWHQQNPDIKGKPETFPLDVPAHSTEEAVGRYMKACGIRSTDHFIRAVPLEDVLRKKREREAMKAIEGDFNEMPAGAF